uniref:Reverse transcriptase domain-containing protein n=1 Tax=Bombyx mori TaxID=7091 RepID=A0A8R2CA25_BOMMO|nr:uncharacterized protein LOC105842916 [Bombyx mori]
MRKALDGWDGGVTVGGTKITNLRYADDTTILAASESEMAAILERIERVNLKFGLHINRSKTKVMTVDRAQVLSPSNALKDYEEVAEFIYLGSLISNSGNCEKEIGRRIGMAKSAMTSLDKFCKDRHNEMFQSLDFLQAKIVKTKKFPEVKSKNSSEESLQVVKQILYRSLYL